MVPVKDRQTISKFPAPYNESKSPYRNMKDFSTTVKNYLAHQRRIKLHSSKVIFIGDVSVGKTTIVNRYCYNKYQSTYKATIGVDFEIESFNILGQNFVLEMWDTAGQERFRCIAQAYYRNANVIVVIFDMSKPNTLDSAADWLRNAMMANTENRPLVFLVGTKSDLLTEPQFINIESSAARMAEKLKAEYWFVSARTGYQVIELFQRIGALAFDRAMKDYIDQKARESKTIKELNDKKVKDSATTKEKAKCAC